MWMLYKAHYNKYKKQRRDIMAENLFIPRTTRKAVSLAGLGPVALAKAGTIPDLANNTGARGIAGARVLEPVPRFISADCETVIANENNASIVLGRDRPNNRISGYGGRGETQCAMIDVVCGRMGADPRQVNEQGEFTEVNPDFKLDAARIYISQKTDIDENFGLVPGRVGIADTKSGIALKADGIRIIARDGIKLITRTDMLNSQGASVESVVGIDLIAGNDDTDIQPMVKGSNLVAAIEELVSHVDALSGIVDSFLMSQMEFNSFATTHFHISPGWGAPTPPSPTMVSSGVATAVKQLTQTKLSLLSHKANLAMYKINFLNPIGKKYINSRYNNTN